MSSTLTNMMHQSKPGFIRVKLIELDPPPHISSNLNDSARSASSKSNSTNNSASLLIDPICAVNIKEMVKSKNKHKPNGNNNSNQQVFASYNSKTNSAHIETKNNSSVPTDYELVQKKPTFYPKWNTCFDCHLYKGRTIQIIVKNSVENNEQIAEVTVTADLLASKAKDKLSHTDWVFINKSSSIYRILLDSDTIRTKTKLQPYSLFYISFSFNLNAYIYTN